ncbi:MAG TPA: hypothetical protein VJ962_02475 [Clostridia bacterium]|nr:hypothetical protein [Clostridia bacterium]
MIKKLILCLVIIFLMGLMVSCVSNDANQDNDLEEIPKGYKLNKNQLDNVEFHEDRIYGLYRWVNPEDNSDWKDALWSFSPYEEANLIAEGKGLSFRVSKNNEYIAVEKQGAIEFYNEDGNLLKLISSETINTEDYAMVQLEKWNDNSNTLWCSLNETYNTIAYIKINTETWALEKYDDLNFNSAEHVLNPNTGWIVYSDYPVFLEITAFDEYMESEQMTTLSIYNLMTKENIEIEKSETNPFKPKWSNDHEILYYIGNQPFFYKLKEQ